MASDTTRRIETDEVVPWAEAIDAWAAAARPVLERVARDYGASVTYSELAEEVQEEAGIRTGVPFRHWIGSVLGALSHAHQDPDEPLLASLVVRADGRIGVGYSVPDTERGEPEPGDRDWHAAVERLRCYEHFGATLPPDGGKPMLTEPVARKRANKARQHPVKRPTEQCPTCFVALPLSGECATCGG